MISTATQDGPAVPCMPFFFSPPPDSRQLHSACPIVCLPRVCRHRTPQAFTTMGIFSGWFSGSSSSAGKIQTPSSGPAAASGPGKPNVWRSVFDPGSNPNIDKVGSAYYDTVHKVRGTEGRAAWAHAWAVAST